MKKNKNVLKKFLLLFGFMFITLATCYKVGAVNVAFSFNRLLLPGEIAPPGEQYTVYPKNSSEVNDHHTTVEAAAQANAADHNRTKEGQIKPFHFDPNPNAVYHFCVLDEESGKFTKIDQNSLLLYVGRGMERILIHVFDAAFWTRMQANSVFREIVLDSAKISEGMFVLDMSENEFFGEEEEEERSEYDDSGNDSQATSTPVPPVRYPITVITVSPEMKEVRRDILTFPVGTSSKEIFDYTPYVDDESHMFIARKGNSFKVLDLNSPIPYVSESQSFPEIFQIYVVPQIPDALKKLCEAERKRWKSSLDAARATFRENLARPGSIPKEESSKANKTLISYGADGVEVDGYVPEELSKEDKERLKMRPIKPVKPKKSITSPQ